jgi:hypothetical protein
LFLASSTPAAPQESPQSASRTLPDPDTPVMDEAEDPIVLESVAAPPPAAKPTPAPKLAIPQPQPAATSAHDETPPEEDLAYFRTSVEDWCDPSICLGFYEESSGAFRTSRLVVVMGTDELDLLRMGVHRYLGPEERVLMTHSPTDEWWEQPRIVNLVNSNISAAHIRGQAHVTVPKYLDMLKARDEKLKEVGRPRRSVDDAHRRTIADCMSARHKSDEGNLPVGIKRIPRDEPSSPGKHLPVVYTATVLPTPADSPTTATAILQQQLPGTPDAEPEADAPELTPSHEAPATIYNVDTPSPAPVSCTPLPTEPSTATPSGIPQTSRTSGFAREPRKIENRPPVPDVDWLKNISVFDVDSDTTSDEEEALPVKAYPTRRTTTEREFHAAENERKRKKKERKTAILSERESRVQVIKEQPNSPVPAEPLTPGEGPDLTISPYITGLVTTTTQTAQDFNADLGHLAFPECHATLGGWRVRNTFGDLTEKPDQPWDTAIDKLLKVRRNTVACYATDSLIAEGNLAGRLKERGDQLDIQLQASRAETHAAEERLTRKQPGTKKPATRVRPPPHSAVTFSAQRPRDSDEDEDLPHEPKVPKRQRPSRADPSKAASKQLKLKALNSPAAIDNPGFGVKPSRMYTETGDLSKFLDKSQTETTFEDLEKEMAALDSPADVTACGETNSTTDLYPNPPFFSSTIDPMILETPADKPSSSGYMTPNQIRVLTSQPTLFGYMLPSKAGLAKVPLPWDPEEDTFTPNKGCCHDCWRFGIKNTQAVGTTEYCEQCGKFFREKRYAAWKLEQDTAEAMRLSNLDDLERLRLQSNRTGISHTSSPVYRDFDPNEL